MSRSFTYCHLVALSGICGIQRSFAEYYMHMNPAMRHIILLGRRPDPEYSVVDRYSPLPNPLVAIRYREDASRPDKDLIPRQ